MKASNDSLTQRISHDIVVVENSFWQLPIPNLFSQKWLWSKDYFIPFFIDVLALTYFTISVSPLRSDNATVDDVVGNRQIFIEVSLRTKSAVSQEKYRNTRSRRLSVFGDGFFRWLSDLIDENNISIYESDSDFG